MTKSVAHLSLDTNLIELAKQNKLNISSEVNEFLKQRLQSLLLPSSESEDKQQLLELANNYNLKLADIKARLSKIEDLETKEKEDKLLKERMLKSGKIIEI
jgi:rRNA-processing protein FCF1